MANLNKMFSDIKECHTELDNIVKKVLKKYESLYYESNRQFITERAASGSMKGLEDFYYMVQVIKRNRDVVGSLMRGMASLRPLKDFKIIEEDIAIPVKKGKPRKNLPPKPSEAQEIETVIEEGANA